MKRKVYLDIGGNKGQGLRKFMEMYQMDESWTIETFEPEILCDLENCISDIKNVKVNKVAVWTHTGKVTFSRYEKNLEGVKYRSTYSSEKKFPNCQVSSSNYFH